MQTPDVPIFLKRRGGCANSAESLRWEPSPPTSPLCIFHAGLGPPKATLESGVDIFGYLHLYQFLFTPHIILPEYRIYDIINIRVVPYIN